MAKLETIFVRIPESENKTDSDILQMSKDQPRKIFFNEKDKSIFTQGVQYDGIPIPIGDSTTTDETTVNGILNSIF